jgi:hypothetical protein
MCVRVFFNLWHVRVTLHPELNTLVEQNIYVYLYASVYVNSSETITVRIFCVILNLIFLSACYLLYRK